MYKARKGYKLIWIDHRTYIEVTEDWSQEQINKRVEEFKENNGHLHPYEDKIDNFLKQQ